MLNVAFSLGKVDVIFFIIILVVIAAAVGFYFLIPVLNREHYKQMRDNLEKREASFKSNIKRELVSHDKKEEQQKDEVVE